MTTTAEAYKAINSLLKKHSKLISYDVEELERKAKNHLFGIELKEVYGFDVDPLSINQTQWVKLNNDFYIGMWGKKYNRTISWPDVKGQPNNEMLLYICFPTGAYIFGDDYPTDLFNKFWDELKTFNPKYTDTMNHSLYFSMENAKDIFNSYKDVLSKYYKINQDDIKKRRADKMIIELKKLENELR